MKKDIIRDLNNGYIRITTSDERWYMKATEDVSNPIYVPSVTWICEYYPKGLYFYKWLASKGWDEAEAIKSAAGDKGSKVHSAIVDLIDGKKVKINSKYLNPTTEEQEELTVQEYECLMSFVDWWNDAKPTILGREFVVWGDGYAGTVDLACVINDETWIIDFKTSQNIWESHELQVNAYKKAYGVETAKMGILQLGYRKNKRNWKLTEISDKFDLFTHAYAIWANECSKIEPKQKDFPIELSINTKEEK